MQLGRGCQTVEADGEVEVQLGRREGLMMGAAAEVEVQLGRGGLAVGAAAEVAVQLGR